MWFWENIGDGVKGIRNYLPTTRVPDAVKKMDQVIRVDAVRKLQQHCPDRAQIGLFTYTFAKNTAKYVAYEGFKHIPGATVVSKLVSDTMREVKQEKHKVGITKEANIAERDMGKSTSQPDNFSQNGNLSSQNAGGDGEVGILVKDLRLSASQPENFCQKGNLSFQGEGGGGAGAGAGAGVGSEAAKDMINMFMKTEFVGNHLFRDLLVPKIARIEKKD